ncbi:HprK-related kinase A [uncultured Thiodictyon sp.]|jgi:HprK-related kinase A|uniref:HprK-related kinase A n=1 Tax=uncultured Thiodictyon sp. TaxID=1846217 RepID=UPI0025ECCA2E|nr:HprK-related kinase A [uncultured Thiodictyon sp.]
MRTERIGDRGDLHRLAAQGLLYRTGPFVIRLQTRLREVTDTFARIYLGTEVLEDPRLAHFSVRVTASSPLRRPWGAQSQFWIDDIPPFEPYPRTHAFPLLEWGINWCIGTRAHRYLLLHAGALERGGRALLLPAMPGSGKSTLSTALAFRGWRFLSDEFGVILPGAATVAPLPRAIPLKNRSIQVIRDFAPEAVMGPVFEKTRKGDVAHVRPPHDSLARQLENAAPGWIVFPCFRAGGTTAVRTLPRSEAFTRLAQNSFNYRLLGERGFLDLTALVRACACFSLDFSDLDQAVAVIEDLASSA